jgi:hypothetical protein
MERISGIQRSANEFIQTVNTKVSLSFQKLNQACDYGDSNLELSKLQEAFQILLCQINFLIEVEKKI